MSDAAPIVLGFDTSRAHCDVAVLRGSAVLAHATEDMARGQAERLMPLIEEVLAKADITWPDLDRIGVGVGPGNFTGIRISVSAARGLALGLGKPAIGVTAFEALYSDSSQMALVTVAAPRASFYAQIWDQGAPLSEPKLVTEADVLPGMPENSEPVHIAHPDDSIEGRGQLALGSRLSGPPMAIGIARAAARRLLPAPRPAPLYIRPADAAPPKDRAPRVVA